MDLRWTKPLSRQPRMILEEAGYHRFVDPNTNQESFVMRLGSRFYPRFHVYINRHDGDTVELSLHLDQKRPSYEGQAAHAGEYEGAEVEEEAGRLARWFTYYAPE